MDFLCLVHHVAQAPKNSAYHLAVANKYTLEWMKKNEFELY